MKQKVIIASCVETVRQILKNALIEFCKVQDALLCCNEYELYELLADENFRDSKTTILSDKYFFGYIVGHKINEIKMMHKERKICFCEEGECSVNFGIRVHELGAYGFIAHIEDLAHLKNELLNAMMSHFTFPDEVVRYLDNLKALNSKNFTEVTRREEEIACCLGIGMSQKQIGYELDLKPTTVSTHVSFLNQKIGHKDDLDYIILN